MVRGRLSTQSGNISKTGKANVLTPCHHFKALHHISTVQSLQRHNITNSPKRNKIEKVHKPGLSALRKSTTPPQLAVQTNKEQEGNTHSCQVALPRQIILPVGIHQRMNLRKALIHLMVIQNHHFQSDPLGFLKGFKRRGTTVYCD